MTKSLSTSNLTPRRLGINILACRSRTQLPKLVIICTIEIWQYVHNTFSSSSLFVVFGKFLKFVHILCKYHIEVCNALLMSWTYFRISSWNPLCNWGPITYWEQKPSSTQSCNFMVIHSLWVWDPMNLMTRWAPSPPKILQLITHKHPQNVCG